MSTKIDRFCDRCKCEIGGKDKPPSHWLEHRFYVYNESKDEEEGFVGAMELCVDCGKVLEIKQYMNANSNSKFITWYEEHKEDLDKHMLQKEEIQSIHWDANPFEELKYELSHTENKLKLLQDKYDNAEYDSFEKNKYTPKPITSFVYLCKNFRNGFIKIGYTSNEPVQRENTLQSQEPEVHHIRIYNGTSRDEEHLHQMFDEKRERGEWFKLDDKDIKKITEYFRSKYITIENPK